MATTSWPGSTSPLSCQNVFEAHLFFFFFFFLSREYHVLAWMLRRPANVHKPMGLSTWETARVERRNDAAYSQIQSSDNIGIEPMLSRAHERDIPPFLKN